MSLPGWTHGTCIGFRPDGTNPTEPILERRRGGAAPLAQTAGKGFRGLEERFHLEGAEVLEIGGATPPSLPRTAGIRRWVCLDPLLTQTGAEEDDYRTLPGRAEALEFPDEQFDVLFTCNSLHHMQEVPKVLAEAHRILRPGGVFYAHFGPIWSAPDGHHLEIEHEGLRYTFWGTPAIPPWFHLVCTPDELTTLLASRLPEGLVQKIVQHTYHSPLLNRLFYEDYLRLVLDSPLTLDEWIPNNELDYQLVPPAYPAPLVETLTGPGVAERVRQQHGEDKVNLYCRDLLVVLRKYRF